MNRSQARRFADPAHKPPPWTSPAPPRRPAPPAPTPAPTPVVRGPDNPDDAAMVHIHRTREAFRKHAPDAAAMLGECRRLASGARLNPRTRDELARVIAEATS